MFLLMRNITACFHAVNTELCMGTLGYAWEYKLPLTSFSL